MDEHSIDFRLQSPMTLAGRHYSELLRNRQSAMEYLASSDYQLRVAAILVCESTWKCGDDSVFVRACKEVALSNANDGLRSCAIGAMGRALDSTKDAEASFLLANLVVDLVTSSELRSDAYWALRQIQFGVRDVNFGTFLKGTIVAIRTVLRNVPDKFSEEHVRANIVGPNEMQDDIWESADDIDLDFVYRILYRNRRIKGDGSLFQ